jgi:signal transduction histidine kinase
MMGRVLARGSGPLGLPSARRGFRLLRWFGIASLACVMLFGIGTALVLGRFLTVEMLERDAEVSAEFLQSIVEAERSWSWFVTPNDSGARLPLASFFNHVAQLPGVVRANVFSADGTVLWSSNEEMVGRRFAGNHELEAALGGRVAVETGELPKEEHLALDRDAGGRRFTEAYLPVWDEQRRNVIGVVEIYRLPDKLFHAIDQGVLRVWISAGLGMALLWLVLFGLMLRAQRLIARQQQALVEAEALAAIGAVASAVAHGIRNPLSSIRSSAELGMVEDPDGARDCLADIQREADRVEGWVRDLLLQARGEVIAPGAVDVNLLLDTSLHSFAGTAARQGIDVRVHHAEVPKALADAGALGQAIDNLIANAIEAMPGGGTLDLRVGRAAGGAQVEIAIADTGGGIPPDVAGGGSLFLSTKPRGTGLGLVLTRRIVERHRGSLTLEDIGSGTRAVIRLPVAPGA